jgi:outer membrane protein X
MKKLILTALITFLAITGGYAQYNDGRPEIGGSIGYAEFNDATTVGIDYRQTLFRGIRIAPSLVHQIRRNNLSAWHIHMDAQYVVYITSIFSFYPIGGINLSIWDDQRVEGNYTRLGFSIGLGGEFRLSKEISLGLDMKYNVVSTYKQVFLSPRIGYHF